MMARYDPRSELIAPLCSICGDEPSTIKTVITDPLIVSVHTFTCPSCYTINAAASAALLAANRRLVLVEVAA